MLPLTFVNAADYDKIREGDRLSIDIDTLAVGQNVTLGITYEESTLETIQIKHTMNEQQLGWFRAGSALNLNAGRQTRHSSWTQPNGPLFGRVAGRCGCISCNAKKTRN